MTPLAGRRAAILLIAFALGLLPGCATAPATAPASAADDAPLAVLSWLAGAWTCDTTRHRIEEHWTPVAGGTMFGVNRTIDGDRTVAFEFMRIATQEGDVIVFHASPGGRSPATPFTLVESSADHVVFENPEHDFPQRVIYRRRGPGAMEASIEGESSGEVRTISWPFRRAPRQ